MPFSHELERFYADLQRFYADRAGEFNPHYADAAQMLGQRQHPKAIVAALVRRGLPRHTADRIVADLRKWDEFFRWSFTALASPKDDATVEIELLERRAIRAVPEIGTELVHCIVCAARRALDASKLEANAGNRGRGFDQLMLGLVLLALFGMAVFAFASTGVDIARWRMVMYPVYSLVGVPGAALVFVGLVQLITGWDKETIERRKGRIMWWIVWGLFLAAGMVCAGVLTAIRFSR